MWHPNRNASPLPATEGILNAQDYLQWIHEAAMGQQIVLVVHETTFWAASTGVTNLDAAQEVSKTMEKSWTDNT